MKQIPLLYESNVTSFSGNMLCSLPDSLSCKVTEERNGEFYCEMSYPAYGMNANYIMVGRILRVKAGFYLPENQGFRITTIEKRLDGMMNITAYHVSYDMSNIIVMPFTAHTAANAMSGMMSNCTPSNSFQLAANGMGSGLFSVTQPTPMRSLLCGSEGSMVDTYGGDLMFNNWKTVLVQHRGYEKNVQIAYGKNLNDFKETDEIASYDAVIPFAVYNDTTYYITDTNVCATAPVVPSSSTHGYPRTIAVDFSDKFTEAAPTDAELLAEAQLYISKHTTSAEANISVGYLDLRKMLGVSENANIGDTIYLNVAPYRLSNIKVRVIRTVYDCLLDEYESIQVGDKKVTLADTLATLIGESS